MIAPAGRTSYASMRGPTRKNAGKVEENASFANEHGLYLYSIELDVQDDGSNSER